MKTVLNTAFLACLPLVPMTWAQTSAVIALVANAEGEKRLIAPNTWIEIKGCLSLSVLMVRLRKAARPAITHAVADGFVCVRLGTA